MKHNFKVTAILVIMFLITQIIGLYVVSSYNNGIDLPYGMEPPEELEQEPQGIQIIIAFIIAITLFFVLIKINAETFIKLWYYTVTVLAIGLSLTVIFIRLNLINHASFIALLIAIPFAYYKIFKKHLIIHNLTELIVYPGIAAVFIPLINVTWIIILLFLISIYDIWAVWQTQFMQKMAKYQINKLQFFTGFFIPYADKKEKTKIRMIREKYANKPKLMEQKFNKANIRVSLAILGGGDVIFPIITAGVFYKYFGLNSAYMIIGSSTLVLLFLFTIARKGKFYPAMPFITIGIYLGMIASKFLGFLI